MCQKINNSDWEEIIWQDYLKELNDQCWEDYQKMICEEMFNYPSEEHKCLWFEEMREDYEREEREYLNWVKMDSLAQALWEDRDKVFGVLG